MPVNLKAYAEYVKTEWDKIKAEYPPDVAAVVAPLIIKNYYYWEREQKAKELGMTPDEYEAYIRTLAYEVARERIAKERAPEELPPPAEITTAQIGKIHGYLRKTETAEREAVTKLTREQASGIIDVIIDLERLGKKWTDINAQVKEMLKELV